MSYVNRNLRARDKLFAIILCIKIERMINNKANKTKKYWRATALAVTISMSFTVCLFFLQPRTHRTFYWPVQLYRSSSDTEG